MNILYMLKWGENICMITQTVIPFRSGNVGWFLIVLKCVLINVNIFIKKVQENAAYDLKRIIFISQVRYSCKMTHNEARVHWMKEGAIGLGGLFDSTIYFFSILLIHCGKSKRPTSMIITSTIYMYSILNEIYRNLMLKNERFSLISCSNRFELPK